MLKRGFDMYVGMRMKAELDACRDAGIFDYVVWVDRSEHLQEESFASMQLKREHADVTIDNNGTLEDLANAVDVFYTNYCTGPKNYVRLAGFAPET